MTFEPQATQALRMADAMPVRTVVVDVAEGPDRGTRVEGESVTIGTAVDNALVVTDETVSRYHARIAAGPDGFEVTDLGSTNGTYLRDVRIGTAVVPSGTSLRLGRSVLSVGTGLPTTVELYDEDRLGPLIGQTQAMRRLMSQVRRVAQRNVGVLVVGESGTGKELVARAVHEASDRARGPFITLDCGAITATLVASELFGYEKGAFTGATDTKRGAFEHADGGTIFLDEIGELPQELQTMLLGAIERRRFCRVGGRREIEVDVRVVAATHRDLRKAVNAGSFRLDLYYRLAVVALEIPPLRERPGDIRLLAEHFAREEGWEGNLSTLIPEDALGQLARYSWPGNVRELRNYVQATLALGEARDLSETEPEPAPEELRQALSRFLDRPYGEGRSRLLHEFERLYLERLMEKSEGNVAQAARMGAVARSHLNDLLRRHGIR